MNCNLCRQPESPSRFIIDYSRVLSDGVPICQDCYCPGCCPVAIHALGYHAECQAEAPMEIIRAVKAHIDGAGDNPESVGYNPPR